MGEQDPWAREAERWIAWARTPGHDAYWYYRDAFFDEIVPDPGGRTLEIGCGEGRVTRDLAERGHDMVAIDLVASMVKAAKDADPKSLYIRADGAALPFRDATFDNVVAYNSLMDVDDMEGTVREAARVLTPRGHLSACIVHPTRDVGEWASEDADSEFVISKPYFGKRPYKGTFERDGISMTFEGWSYALEDYFRALEGAGFVVETLREPVPVGTSDAAHTVWQRAERIPMFVTFRAVRSN